ncbi:hypothetical protein ScPMuIL_009150 [Solemya velum]
MRMAQTSTRLPSIEVRDLPSVKHVKVFRNDDFYFLPRQVNINEKKTRTFDCFLDDLNDRIHLPRGAVRRVYTPGGSRVTGLGQLEDGRDYIAAGNEPYRKLAYTDIESRPRRPPRARNDETSLPTVNPRFRQISGRYKKIKVDGKTILIHINGDELNPPRVVLLEPKIQHNWDGILNAISERIKYSISKPLDKLFTREGVPILDPTDLHNNHPYVAVAAHDVFRPRQYGLGLPNIITSPRYDRRSRRVMGQGNSYFHAKPVKHKRTPPDKAQRNLDFDKDQDGVFKAKNHNRVTAGAREVQETRDTKVDVPIDQVEPEEITEELSRHERTIRIPEDKELSKLPSDHHGYIQARSSNTQTIQNADHRKQARKHTNKENRSPTEKIEQNEDKSKYEDRSPIKEHDQRTRNRNRQKEADHGHGKKESRREADHSHGQKESKRRANRSRYESPSPNQLSPIEKDQNTNNAAFHSSTPTSDAFFQSPQLSPPQSPNDRAHDRAEEKRLENEAATKIQAGYRGHKARGEVKLLKDERDARQEQKEDTLVDDVGLSAEEQQQQNEKENAAATKIQANYRGYKTRKDIGKQQVRGDDTEFEQVYSPTPTESDYASSKEVRAATTIQSGYRGHQARKEVSKLRGESAQGEEGQSPNVTEEADEMTEEEAAATIEAGFKGYQAREEIRHMKEEKRRDNAAVKIQANYRGYKTRKDLSQTLGTPESLDVDLNLNGQSPEPIDDDNVNVNHQSPEPLDVDENLNRQSPEQLDDDSSNPIHAPTQQEHDAATKIQANYKGYSTRKKLKAEQVRQVTKSRVKSSRSLAATRVQACFRGYQTRNKIKEHWESMQTAASKLQSAFWGLKIRGEVLGKGLHSGSRLSVHIHDNSFTTRSGEIEDDAKEKELIEKRTRALNSIQAMFWGYVTRLEFKDKKCLNLVSNKSDFENEEVVGSINEEIKSSVGGLSLVGNFATNDPTVSEFDDIEFQKNKIKLDIAASNLQAQFRGIMLRTKQTEKHIHTVQRAVSIVQASFRGYQLRKYLQEKNNYTHLKENLEKTERLQSIEKGSVSKLQAIFRACITREQIQKKATPQMLVKMSLPLQKKKSVGVLQGAFRAYLTRASAISRDGKTTGEERVSNSSVAVIQSAFRGFQTRILLRSRSGRETSPFSSRIDSKNSTGLVIQDGLEVTAAEMDEEKRRLSSFLQACFRAHLRSRITRLSSQENNPGSVPLASVQHNVPAENRDTLASARKLQACFRAYLTCSNIYKRQIVKRRAIDDTSSSAISPQHGDNFAVAQLQALFRALLTRKEIKLKHSLISSKPSIITVSQNSVKDEAPSNVTVISEKSSMSHAIPMLVQGHSEHFEAVEKFQAVFRAYSTCIKRKTEKHFVENPKSQVSIGENSPDKMHDVVKTDVIILQAWFRAYQSRMNRYGNDQDVVSTSTRFDSKESQMVLERESDEQMMARAATCIQSWVQGYTTRRDLRVIRQSRVSAQHNANGREQAATKIQTRYRGYAAKKELKRRKTEQCLTVDNGQQDAACLIQAYFRGYQVRKDLKYEAGNTGNSAVEIVSNQIQSETTETVSTSPNVDVDVGNISKSPVKDAVGIVQAMFRGYWLRKQLQTARKADPPALLSDGNISKSSVSTPVKDAVGIVQAMFRGYWLRKHLQTRKADLPAVLSEAERKITSPSDQGSSVQSRSIDSVENQSAIVIQSRFRGFQARQHLKSSAAFTNVGLVSDKTSVDSSAASCLQAAYRGYLTRRKLKITTESDGSLVDVRTRAKEYEVSSRMQAIFRGFGFRLARKMKSNSNLEPSCTHPSPGNLDQQEKVLAANVLQAAFRGFNIRLRPIDRLCSAKRLGSSKAKSELTSNFKSDAEMNHLQAASREWRLMSATKNNLSDSTKADLIDQHPRNESASKLQVAFRRYLSNHPVKVDSMTKKIVTTFEMSCVSEEHLALSMVQATFRGYLTRKEHKSNRIQM